MPRHANFVELKRRKARLEEELERLNQQLQHLRRLRAQIVRQQMDLLRLHGSKHHYDELQQQYQALLKLSVATIEEQVIIADLLLQFEQILAQPDRPQKAPVFDMETLKVPLLHLTRLDAAPETPRAAHQKTLIPF